jgi:hypothetical protein
MSSRTRQALLLSRFARTYWLFGWLVGKARKEYRLRWTLLIALHAAFPLLAFVAGWADDTTKLLPRGRGVVEHYGFHALFLSAPILAFLAWRVATAMALIISQPFQAMGVIRSAESVRLQNGLEDVALCRKPKMQVLLALMRFVGIVAVVANAASTRIPESVYGQDVFDSSSHALGYLAGRLFLGYYWIYLLPLVAYLAVSAIVAAVRIAAYVDDLPDYEIRCFASDGCGGFKELGRLMTLVVYVWVPIVAVVIALMETHTNFYATLRVGAALVILIPAQLFLPFLRLHRVLTRLKERKLKLIEHYMNESERSIDVRTSRRNDQGTSERSIVPYVRLLAGDSIYRQTTAMSTWPYIKSDVLRWLTPFVPVLVSFTLKRLGVG